MTWQQRPGLLADDTIEAMVKGITSVAAIASGEAFERLSGLFRALGFEEGKGWDDGGDKGAAFLAPVGNLELVTRPAPSLPSLLVEVTQLEAVYSAVRAWMLNPAAGNFRTEEIVVKLAAIAPTHW